MGKEKEIPSPPDQVRGRLNPLPRRGEESVREGNGREEKAFRTSFLFNLDTNGLI
jgi:hypothetical protein